LRTGGKSRIQQVFKVNAGRDATQEKGKELESREGSRTVGGGGSAKSRMGKRRV